MASFTKEVNSRLAKRPLVFNGRLANRGLTSLVKDATGVKFSVNLKSSLVIELGRMTWLSKIGMWNAENIELIKITEVPIWGLVIGTVVTQFQ